MKTAGAQYQRTASSATRRAIEAAWLRAVISPDARSGRSDVVIAMRIRRPEIAERPQVDLQAVTVLVEQILIGDDLRAAARRQPFAHRVDEVAIGDEIGQTAGLELARLQSWFAVELARAQPLEHDVGRSAEVAVAHVHEP